jgi:glycosyltransferase involved in cell wall biosynthesis
MLSERRQQSSMMNSEPPDADVKVSVVIPVYNMAEYVGEAIGSALDAGIESVEVIVIDDGSTDDTRSVVEAYTDRAHPRYDERVRYEYQTNRGKSAAVNRGLEMSHGKYITILDADDQLTPASLSLRYSALEGGTDARKELVIGEFEVFDHEGEIVGHRPLLAAIDSESLYRTFYLSHKSPFHLNACLFSRELCVRVGLFDVRLRRCQDIDYSLRLLKVANQVAWVHEAVYRYRKHRSNYMERARVRGRTLTHRPLVYWKNYEGWRRYAAVCTGMVLDAGKFLYEITGNYQN